MLVWNGQAVSVTYQSSKICVSLICKRRSLLAYMPTPSSTFCRILPPAFWLLLCYSDCKYIYIYIPLLFVFCCFWCPWILFSVFDYSHVEKVEFSWLECIKMHLTVPPGNSQHICSSRPHSCHRKRHHLPVLPPLCIFRIPTFILQMLACMY